MTKLTNKGVVTSLTLLLSTNLYAATLQGTVKSKADKEPLIDANVIVVDSDFGAATDLDGKFVIYNLPPGVYAVKTTMVGYEEVTSEGVIVREGEPTVLEVVLESKVIQAKAVEVKGAAKKGSVERQITERLSATGITDAISSQTIKSLPDPDVSQVVKRATGVSTIGGDPVIRGLGVRYSKVTMNASQVSGTEPNRSGVSLDLFPTSMIQSIKVSKSYQVDQFGEFAGGVIDMNTWEVGSVKEFAFSYSLGFKPDITFQTARGYKGGDLDIFGFDDGTREMPDPIKNSEHKIVSRGRFSSDGYTPAELEEFGEMFQNNWNTHEYTAAPNSSMSLTYSNSVPVMNRNLNYMISGLYKNSRSYKEVHRNLYKGGLGGEIDLAHYYDFQYWSESVALGAMASLRYDFSPLHKVNLSAVINQDADDETRYYEGYNSDRDKTLSDTRLRLVMQNIATMQMSGRHVFTQLNKSSLNWQMTFSEGKRDEPDTREVQYDKGQNDSLFRLANEPKSGARIFNDLDEHTRSGDVSLLYPVTETWSLKLGSAFITRDRDAQTRFFHFEAQRGVSGFYQDPETLYGPDNIGPNKIMVRETTRPTDSYTAAQRLEAYYLMSDGSLTDRIRLIAGVRYEKSLQEVKSYELFTSAESPTVGRLDGGDYLPAFSVVYKLRERSNLRFNASQTVSRPDFRELSAYEFTDITGGRAVIGNPSLKRALIQNFDIRFDKSTGVANLFSVSLFYKHFVNPIETVIQPTAQLRTSYENAASADNFGMELEAIYALGDLNRRLSPWSVSANLTLLQSDIQLDDSTKGVQTSKRRPLHGQSPYLMNLGLQYSDPIYRTQASLFFNVFGKRITEVGAKPLPDLYELPHPDLDLAVQQPLNKQWTIKGSINNILNSKKTIIQGEKVTEEYRDGLGFSIGLSYKN